MGNNFIGISDSPVGEDHLGMEPRCRGIADFVKECRTPMTIAIQGDWGSGKSTALKLIGNYLENGGGSSTNRKACIINFNTWQFSALGKDENLIIDLMSVMHSKLEAAANSIGSTETVSRCEDFKKVFKTFLKYSLNAGKRIAGDSIAGKLVFTAGEMLLPEGEKPSVSSVEIVDVLKENMEAVIKGLAANTGGRVYVFIDDLDRLDPRVAVELMEGLKIFADYEDCVFILAVDQDVVERGLKSKYGEDFDSEKARKFFDKIIQVPFAMPVNSYDLRSYVSQFLPNGCGNVSEYVRLLGIFKEHNPRTIKRSFNALLLDQCIHAHMMSGAADALTEDEQLKQYAVRLLQLESREGFRQLLLIIDDHVKNIENGDYCGFCDDLHRLFSCNKLNDPAVSAYLRELAKLFYNVTAPDPHNSQKNGIQKFIDAVRQFRTISAESETGLETSRVIRSLSNLHDRFAGEGLDLPGEWSLFGAGDNKAILEAHEKGNLTLSVKKEDDEVIRIVWKSKSDVFDIIIIQVSDFASAFSGVEKYFTNNEGDTDGKYYYIMNKTQSRMTVSGITGYQKGCSLDGLLKNVGIIREV